MVTLTSVLGTVEGNQRVCPQPQKWHRLYQLLPRQGRTSPPVPLILGAWWHTTPAHKQECLREQIEWASAHGVLDVVSAFLNSLQESDWVHLSEAPSGRVDINWSEESND